MENIIELAYFAASGLPPVMENFSSNIWTTISGPSSMNAYTPENCDMHKFDVITS